MKIITTFLLLFCSTLFSQENNSSKELLRIGLIYGFSSQDTYVKQDSDYSYESAIYKLSTHFNIYKTKKHSWEFLVEPSYYRSKHQLYNFWYISHTVANGDELREKYMRLKTINEYVMNLGLIYRYDLNPNLSLYALVNVGPMYIDTDTERLKKGFAFSDIFALGSNYKVNKVSFDVKCTIRHVSNANLQHPNFGLNSVGFEFGTYYEFN